VSRPASPAPPPRSSGPATPPAPPSPGSADLAQADLAQADLAQALTRAVSGEVRFDAMTRGLFARDASMYAIEPIGVVFPRDVDDVCAVISTAAQFGVPVLPRGAGTSLAGQTVGRAVVIDLSRHMHDITALDAEGRVATVQPGVVQEQLNLRAAADGLIFGPDTSTRNRATIGGMIGNNSSGSHSIRYGCTADHVLELDVVLSDGSRAHLAPVSEAERARRAGAGTLEGRIYAEVPALLDRHRDAIATGYPDSWRQSGGYRLDRLAAAPELDLSRLVVGSEGTLAVVTAATVRLVGLPRHRVIGVGHFTSVAAAIDATQAALACDPAAVELIDRFILELSRDRIEYRGLTPMLTGDPGALLFVTFFGDSEREAADGLDRLERAWQAHHHGYHLLRAVSPADQAELLRVREAGLGLLMSASVGTRRPLAFIEDTAVDPARLTDYTARLRDVLDRRGLAAGFYGHASVGCLHIRPFVDLAEPGQAQVMRTVAEQVRDLVLEFGGVNSSEHGDGLARSEFNEKVFGPALYQAMRETKRAFDPDNRMNPGKIVDAPAMTEHLRDGSVRIPVPPPTRLRFPASGGMRAAADRCMNIGACRKTFTGVMCPSYMATRDEEHSTRGRANALVAALSMPDPLAALGDERLHQVLDLCLECKACKRECPLGIDMATLKSEFLASYQDIHGVPLRSRLFGSIRAVNRVGSALAPLSNLPAKSRTARRLLERLLGLSAARPMPRFHRRNLLRWYRRHRPSPATPSVPPEATRGVPLEANPGTPPPATPSAGELVFLADCFTTFTEPQVGIAAIELLERAGWTVRLEAGGCCGRASLSKGLVDRAQRQAARLVARLSGDVAQGRPIVAAEPSCLLTLRDDYPALLAGDENARAVASATRLPEELILEALAAGRLRLRNGPPQTLVFHGHCHQKAVVGTAATVDLLSSIPDTTVTELDAGCCGMAGSFGYEAEHYDLSMQIAELRLFPQVRAQPPGTLIAATGTSCRQQLAHGTSSHPAHPLEIIRSRVE
jgi:FAD/FMN-containing dehydrogenase/Fe-S oxidoreductase